MLRTPHASERVQMLDPKTGIRITQLTSYPTPSVHLLYYWPSVTPDNKRIVFLGQRSVARRAPWDLFRCDTDGLGLCQLTDYEQVDRSDGLPVPPAACMTLDGTKLYLTRDAVLCELDVETGTMRDLVALDRFCRERSTFSHVRIGASGRIFLSQSFYAPYAVRVNLATGEVAEIDLGGSLFACSQDEQRLLVGRNRYSAFWSLDEDGGDPRFHCENIFAHTTTMGRLPGIQGPGRPPERCIWLAHEGKPAERLVEGPYFWHSAASFDGEWIVSDTNWPDEGIKLVHVPTRHWRTLCHAHATQGHPQWQHCHPALSQDGRIAVFDSDRTGVSQVYVAHVSEEFRERVKAGELDRPRDKWI
ncbi:MAG TPA: hypothetical protein P5569_13170 [Candidatus Latescibacteria bacterium]|nr:hypothetical protein [Candidatus Latescibacterota bacterium]